ncbi:hypothetical protein ABMY26_18665 [Azospirillum sp. HJ39]|uniref:hypothetical protein n=1 Tax=Azospirillum sp. HJ39 TaxID=3159496 RepID=UPI0035576F22
MTAVIVPFVGAEDRTARQNVDAFIEHAKSYRWFTAGFGSLQWSSASWDLRPFFAGRGQNPVGLVVHFTTYETRRKGVRSPTAVDFAQPFLDQARALVVEFMRTTANSSPSKFLTVLRCVEKAFRDLGKAPDIIHLTPTVLDHATEIIRADLSDQWSFGRFLERLALELVNTARLSKAHLLWRNPFQYQGARRNDRVNMAEGDHDGVEKLPHLKCVLDLAGVFHTSDYVPDVVVTAWFALGMFAPSRVNEILTLPAGCETEMDGTYGISWRPLKGGEPMTKFATTAEWAEIAREAVRRLTVLGAQARTAAKWYEDNPGQLFLPSGWEHLRGQPLTRWEIAKILGKSSEITSGSVLDRALEATGDRTKNPARTGTEVMTSRKGVSLYTFASVERYVASVLPNGFPFADKKHDLKASDALFCLPRNILRGFGDTEEYVPDLISYSQVKHELGSKPAGQTIFERHGLVDPDTGKPWKLNTHQPRHLLNTLAQSKHLSQALIAFWSGRKKVSQNAWYDHIPQEAFIDAFLRMGERAPREIRIVGPLEEKVAGRARKEAISHDVALRLELGSVISTRFGLCRHNYALTPCPKDKNCINCGENTFIKGDERHLAEARNQLAITQRALANCRRALDDGEPGVERWLKIHAEKEVRWAAAIRRMLDPATPDGTLITLPPPRRPQAKTGLAAEVRDVVAPDTADEKVPGDELALLRGV